IAIIVLFGLSEGEAACRAAGKYRVTGPASGGLAVLTETGSDEPFTSGTVVLDIFPKRTCPVCSIAGRSFTGEYWAGPLPDGSCAVALRFAGAATGLPRSLSGPLGIRKDALLRP